MARRSSPDKKELARMKAMVDLGVSPTAVARRLGRSHHTVLRYLRSEVYQDPEVQTLVQQVKERELQDLYLLGAKARDRLHDLLDAGDVKPIEATAIMDRAFQQRRLLEGGATQIINLQELKQIDAQVRIIREQLLQHGVSEESLQALEKAVEEAIPEPLP